MQEPQSSQQSSEAQQSENQLQIVQTETRRPIRRVGELIITEEGQRTIATRESTGHTAIVRMTGGNTRVTVTHDGAAATETVGTGSNIVNITQKR
jgi:hypothetical protein